MESNYAEENISTKQSPTRQKARLSREDGDQERTRRSQAPPGERPQTPDGSALLSFRLPKEARIAKRAEFLGVYEHGKRFEGRFMTVFILPNDRKIHRVGITATKKAIGKAHDRNRAKRLLREAFRLSPEELEAISGKFDWVLNARRSILAVKLEKPLAEFKVIAAKIGEMAAREILPQGTQNDTEDKTGNASF
jgi:ribonuclease P protein component